MDTSSKSFEKLQSDYDFFEAHVDERQQALQAWEPWLQQLRQRPGLRLLDFGSGSGSFTSMVLERLGLPPSAVRLTMLEPAASARERARLKLHLWNPRLIVGVSELEGSYDLIISHHVFYYVPELRSDLLRIRGHLAASGVFLAAIAGEQSGPGQLQDQALQLISQTSPYRSGVESAAIFRQVFTEAVIEPFSTRLQMEDSRTNRQRLMRFLVGEFAGVPQKEALALLDPYSNGGVITVPSVEQCLASAPPEGLVPLHE